MDKGETGRDAEQDAPFEGFQTIHRGQGENYSAERHPVVIRPSGSAVEKGEEITAQEGAANDKYLRLLAEFENYKRRNAHDNERRIETANEQLIKELIEVLENFERAFKSNVKGEKFVDGMKLNYARLNSILEKYGLEAYAERGNEFTPKLHDAVMCAPHQSIADSHISDVLERGYSLKGKIIKHAKVAVSSGRPKGKTAKS
jgi:molecular chaperone GrpE